MKFDYNERRVKAYTQKDKCDLTAKQLLVYNYLASKALVNRGEVVIEEGDENSEDLLQIGHYYIYFRNIAILKDSESLGIDPHTYSRAIKVLLEKGYITTPWYTKQKEYEAIQKQNNLLDLTPEQKADIKKIKKKNPWYHIPIPDIYIPLSQNKIANLIKFGNVYFEGDAKKTGDLIGVLSILYKIWKASKMNKKLEWINATEIGEIMHRANGSTGARPHNYYETIMWHLMGAQIVKAEQDIKVNPYSHKNYIDFRIKNVNLSALENLGFDEGTIDKIKEMIEGIANA